MLAIILVVGPLQDALFGFVLIANAADRHRAGAPGEANPRPAHGAHRAEGPGGPRRRAGRGRGRGGRARRRARRWPPGARSSWTAWWCATDGMEVDESLLTGESDPVEKAAGDEVLSGSFVAAGSGRYRATKVGKEAYAVQLAQDARRFTLTKSELRGGIDRDPHLRHVRDRAHRGAAVLLADPGQRRRLARSGVGRGGRHGRDGARGAGAAHLAGVRRGGRAARAPARAWCRSCPRSRGSRASTSCASTRPAPSRRASCRSKRWNRWHRRRRDAVAEAALAALAAADPSPNATTLAIAERFDAPPAWNAGPTVPFSQRSEVERRRLRRATARGCWARRTCVLALGRRARRPPQPGSTELSNQGKRVVLLSRGTALDGDTLPGDLEPAALVILARPSPSRRRRHPAVLPRAGRRR